ncbi:MAG TPA: acetyl-CoA C-acyltransferase, partial [Pirellulales bacterium]|nr:acetyl-CoA C-acyltransferase [Pirellulales bacterium]
VLATAVAGVEPRIMGMGPAPATRKVLAKTGLSLSEIDVIELNEAFAAQCLACMRPLEAEPDKTNIHGGAIALGHPIGASGARVLVTLLYALAERGLKRGLAALCLGGGNAVAMIVERES